MSATALLILSVTLAAALKDIKRRISKDTSRPTLSSIKSELPTKSHLGTIGIFGRSDSYKWRFWICPGSDSWFTLNVLPGFQYKHENCQTCLKTMKAVSQLKNHLFVPKWMNHCCVPDSPIAQTACFLSLTLNTNLMENPANFQMEWWIRLLMELGGNRCRASVSIWLLWQLPIAMHRCNIIDIAYVCNMHSALMQLSSVKFVANCNSYAQVLWSDLANRGGGCF